MVVNNNFLTSRPLGRSLRSLPRGLDDGLPPAPLCLPPALRLRQWNVEDHPFRVELGKVTAREFERLVKSIFTDVTVTFERRCGGRTGLPWITTEIRSANREVYYEIEDDLQYTAITLVTSIHEPDGRERWVETTESVVAAPPALGGYGASWGRSGILEILFPPALAVTDLRLAHASREFGRAIEQGLREIDQNLRRLDGLSADSRLIPGDQEGPEA